MVILGIILILLAAAAAYFLFIGVSSITDNIEITMPLGTLELPPLAFLITGMVVISLFWLGWALLRGGTKRSARLRRESKEAAAKAKADAVAADKRLKDETAAREAQLAAERRRHEEETAQLQAEADARVREQHLATETARQRAENAERRLDNPPA